MSTEPPTIAEERAKESAETKRLRAELEAAAESLCSERAARQQLERELVEIIDGEVTYRIPNQG